MTPNATVAVQHQVTFDLHGIISLRLINPAPQDVAAVAALCGAPQPLSTPAPDITIRFTEKLCPVGLTYVGLNTLGFTEEGFYLLDGKEGQARARIPFEVIGDPCEILCQQGLGAVPLLEEIINLTFLKKGYIPLHAAAFVYEGRGVLVLGWSKSGKTETMLAFANHGAHYVGDEWVVLSHDGQRMFGLTHSITIQDWQFKYLSNLLPPVPHEQKVLFHAIYLFDRLHRALAHSRLARRFPLRQLGKALPLLKDQLKIAAQPATLFADRMHNQGTPVDTVVLTLSHSDPKTRVEPCQPCEIAQRMSHSNNYELLYFFKHYLAFKFAFPGRRNEFLETITARQEAMICQALADKPAYKMFHPYPVAFEALFAYLQPFCTMKENHNVYGSADRP